MSWRLSISCHLQYRVTSFSELNWESPTSRRAQSRWSVRSLPRTRSPSTPSPSRPSSSPWSWYVGVDRSFLLCHAMTALPPLFLQYIEDVRTGGPRFHYGIINKRWAPVWNSQVNSSWTSPSDAPPLLVLLQARFEPVRSQRLHPGQSHTLLGRDGPGGGDADLPLLYMPNHTIYSKSSFCKSLTLRWWKSQRHLLSRRSRREEGGGGARAFLFIYPSFRGIGRSGARAAVVCRRWRRWPRHLWHVGFGGAHAGGERQISEWGPDPGDVFFLRCGLWILISALFRASPPRRWLPWLWQRLPCPPRQRSCSSSRKKSRTSTRSGQKAPSVA